MNNFQNYSSDFDELHHETASEEKFIKQEIKYNNSKDEMKICVVSD